MDSRFRGNDEHLHLIIGVLILPGMHVKCGTSLDSYRTQIYKLRVFS